MGIHKQPMFAVDIGLSAASQLKGELLMKNRRHVLALLMVAAMAACFGMALTPVGSGEKKDPPVKDVKADEQPNPDMEAAKNIATANHLIEYGRQHKLPEALITAVGMYHRTNFKEQKHENADDTPLDKVIDNDLRALLKEARSMRPADKNLTGLADQTAMDLNEKPRGIIGTALTTRVTLKAGASTFLLARQYNPTNGNVSVRNLGIPSDQSSVTIYRNNAPVKTKVGNSIVTFSWSIPATDYYRIGITNQSRTKTANYLVVSF
jgi:hypothetical protein